MNYMPSEFFSFDRKNNLKTNKMTNTTDVAASLVDQTADCTKKANNLLSFLDSLIWKKITFPSLEMPQGAWPNSHAPTMNNHKIMDSSSSHPGTLIFDSSRN